jgi:hypothetical protein
MVMGKNPTKPPTSQEIIQQQALHVNFDKETQGEFLRLFGPRISRTIQDAKDNGFDTQNMETYCISQSSVLSRLQQCASEIGEVSSRLK